MENPKNVDSFNDRLARFMARATDDNIGLQVLQSEMQPIINERNSLIDGPDRVNALTRFLDARMRLYDSDEDIRAAYSVMGVRDRDGSEGDAVQLIKSLLGQIFALSESPQTINLSERLQRRNLQLELHELVVQSVQLPPIHYVNDQLEYSDTGTPVTSPAALKLDRTSRARMELLQVAQRALVSSEFITSSRRLIALIPADINLRDFVRVDMEKLFLVSGAAGSGTGAGSVFDSFREGKGNCRVYQVTFGGGGGITVEVLVATRDIEKGEQLYRDYSDTELYKIWESYNDTASIQHENTATGHNERRLRHHIGSLQLGRIQALSSGDGEGDSNNDMVALDYQIRINLLSNLLVQ